MRARASVEVSGPLDFCPETTEESTANMFRGFFLLGISQGTKLS